MFYRIVFFLFILSSIALSKTVLSSEFDLLTRGVRSESMGGAGCASSKEAYVVFYNPALLANVEKTCCAIEYTPIWNMGDYFTSAAASLILKGNIGLGIGYSRFQINDIKIYPELEGNDLSYRLNNIDLRSDGKSDGVFASVYDNLIFTVAKWYKFKIAQDFFYRLMVPVYISGGASIKFYRQIFDFNDYKNYHNYEGYSNDIDLGFLLKFILDKDLLTGRSTKILNIGLSFKNIIQTSIEYNSQRAYMDDGERIRILGMSYSQFFKIINSSVSMAWDIAKRKEDLFQKIGLEYGFKEIFFVRAGYYKGINAVTFGCGIIYKMMSIDYSYRYHKLSNTPYRIGLSYSF